MAQQTLEIELNSARATADLAARMAVRLLPGDTVLLSGPVGAGKTHFARALIQSMQDMPEDVPSPTFTLVQTYQTAGGEVWHADLYRLGDPGEIIELGLQEAFDSAICLVEWPDRLGPDAPPDALEMNIAYAALPDARIASLRWHDPKWTSRLAGLGK